MQHALCLVMKSHSKPHLAHSNNAQALGQSSLGQSSLGCCTQVPEKELEASQAGKSPCTLGTRWSCPQLYSHSNMQNTRWGAGPEVLALDEAVGVDTKKLAHATGKPHARRSLAVMRVEGQARGSAVNCTSDCRAFQNWQTTVPKTGRQSYSPKAAWARLLAGPLLKSVACWLKNKGMQMVGHAGLSLVQSALLAPRRAPE